MLIKGPHCTGCVLETLGEGFGTADGTGKNGVLLVFEALGKDEAEVGRPMVGKAGQQFETMLRRGGFERDDFKIHNVVNCRPPNNKLSGAPYAQEAISHCAPYLDATVAAMRPRCIVAGGATALRRVLPDCPVRLTDARGYVHWSDKYQTWVVPTWHPSHILRGQTALTLVFIHDVDRAVDIAKNGFSYLPLDFLSLDPTPRDTDAWVKAFEMAVACRRVGQLSIDIETWDKDQNEDELEDEDDEEIKDRSFVIVRCGYSWHDQFDHPHVLSIPWGGEYTQFHRRLCASLIDKVFWNKGFDVPRILHSGLQIRGVIHDGMESWHVLNSDLRRNLGNVSTFFHPRLQMWKHTSSEQPALYNGVDAYAADVNHAQSVELLKKHELWLVYKGQILDFDPVTSAMTAAGMPVDVGRRREAAQQLTTFHDECRASMQPLVPDEARRLQPKEGYVRAPKDTSGLKEVLFDAKQTKRCSICQAIGPRKTHFTNKTIKVSQPDISKRAPNPCLGGTTLVSLEGTKRWARVLPFIPSPKQILTYMAFRGHTPFKERDNYGVFKPTTNFKALKKMLGKYGQDRLYGLILQDRKLTKLAGTYIGWWVED